MLTVVAARRAQILRKPFALAYYTLAIVIGRKGARMMRVWPHLMWRRAALALLLIICLASKPLCGEVGARPAGDAAFVGPCHDLLGKNPNTELVAACFEAAATLSAANAGIVASNRVAVSTLWAGALAFGGSFLASLLAVRAIYIAERVRKRSHQEHHQSAYIAEIRAVLDFLKDADIVNDLRSHANAKSRLSYHPGNPHQWLSVYYSNPSEVGAFRPEVARELVWFYARMYSQLARLIYLHELDDAMIMHMGMERIGAIQQSIADGLVELDRRGTNLAASLASGRLLPTDAA